MTKGVNRQVLEIHDTGSEYFEKAMFFIKPEFSSLSEKKLTATATKLLSSKTELPKLREQQRKSGIILAAKLTAAAGIGAAITALIK